MDLFFSLAMSLALTLILELAFAWVWRVKRQDLPAVGLVNLLTNPIVVLCHCAAAWYVPTLLLPVTLALEAGAVLAEGAVYRRRSQIVHPFAFSLCANAVSFLSGLLLP